MQTARIALNVLIGHCSLPEGRGDLIKPGEGSPSCQATQVKLSETLARRRLSEGSSQVDGCCNPQQAGQDPRRHALRYPLLLDIELLFGRPVTSEALSPRGRRQVGHPEQKCMTNTQANVMYPATFDAKVNQRRSLRSSAKSWLVCLLHH